MAQTGPPCGFGYVASRESIYRHFAAGRWTGCPVEEQEKFKGLPPLQGSRYEDT